MRTEALLILLFVIAACGGCHCAEVTVYHAPSQLSVTVSIKE